MKNNILNLIYKLNDSRVLEAGVIPWAAPIIAFGDLINSHVATFGLNPSNLEFITSDGEELKDNNRRLPTLGSLGLDNWSSTEESHLNLILDSYNEYFYTNPYDAWFKRLDFVISGTSASYYFPSLNACHVDMIPFATFSKWSELKAFQKTILTEIAGEMLISLIVSSPVKIIVLNGKSVIRMFEKVFDIKLKETLMQNWTLDRKGSKGVYGYSYKANVNTIGNKTLDRELLILGFSHNIQSSFGVSHKVLTSIRNWITNQTK